VPAAASALVRGFKAQSQRISVEQRALLGLPPHAPLDPKALAAYHGVVICTPLDLTSLGDDDRAELLDRHPREWSAVSIALPDGTVVVVCNPTHPEDRENNTLSHELSHLLLRHKHGQMRSFADCMMRDFDDRQEAEADWLAGSLLVPEAALRRAKHAGLTHAETARWLGASEQLIRWRWSASGVDRYIRYRSARPSPRTAGDLNCRLAPETQSRLPSTRPPGSGPAPGTP
jgi:IrrE N-terminal-like domain